MATIYNHIRTSTIDDNGNVDVLYPETTGADVSVDRSNNNKIPAVATDAQALANNLSSSAFESPIDDSVTGADSAWSSDKINTRAGNVDLKVGADNGLHFTNSVGEDYILDLTKAVGTATAAQVLSGYTFSNASKLGLNGAMTNNGQVVYTLNPGETQTIAQGYHDGTGYVTVPENTGTYTYAVNTTGATVDLGATNTYRYVNAENVYNYGLAQGTTVHTGTYTLTEEDFDSTVDMGVDHSYRYISVPAGGSDLIINLEPMTYIALNAPYTPQAIVYNTVTTIAGGVIVGVHDTSCKVHPYAVSGGNTMVVGVDADGARTSLKVTGTASETGSVSIAAGQYEWLEIKVGSSKDSINSSGRGQFKFDS